MPASTGVAEAPARAFNPQEVLAFGANIRNPALLKAEAIANAKKLVDLRASGTTGKEGLRQKIAQAEHGAYSGQSQESFKAAFGAGAVALDNRGLAKVDSKASAEQKAVAAEAGKLIDKYSGVLSYLELQSSSSPGAEFTKLKAANNPDLQRFTSYATMLTECLRTIANDPGLALTFPELFKAGVTESERIRLVEDTLLKDTRLRAKYSARLGQVMEEALKLAPAESDEKTQELKDKKEEAEQTYKEKIDEIYEAVEKIAPGAYTRDNVKDLLKTADKDTVARTIQREILKKNKISSGDIRRFERYWEIQDEIKDLNKKLTSPGYNATGYAILNNNLANLNTEAQGLTGVGVRNIKRFENRAATYQQIIEEIMGTEDAPSGLRNIINEAVANRISSKSADLKLKSGGRVRRGGNESLRLLQERKLLGQLESSLSESIIDVLEERYEEMNGLELRRQSEVVSKEKENRVANAKRGLHGQMNNRWMQVDATKRTEHGSATNVAQDMRALIYAEGENGLKKIMLRDMFGAGTLIDVLEPHPTDPSKMVKKRYTWNQIDFSQHELTGDFKETFESVYSSEAEAYKKKLFGDYFMIRTLADRTFGLKFFGKYIIEGSPAQLAFKEHEWKALHNNYGAVMEQALTESKSAQGFLQEMKNKGLVPTTKLKWLLYFITVVLGVGAFAVNPLAGLGVAGAGLVAGKGYQAH